MRDFDDTKGCCEMIVREVGEDRTNYIFGIWGIGSVKDEENWNGERACADLREILSFDEMFYIVALFLISICLSISIQP